MDQLQGKITWSIKKLGDAEIKFIEIVVDTVLCQYYGSQNIKRRLTNFSLDHVRLKKSLKTSRFVSNWVIHPVFIRWLFFQSTINAFTRAFTIIKQCLDISLE